MDILGIGPLELIVILLVALAVFGPDRLPAIGAKLGRAMRDMRKATHEFSREIEAARKAVEAPLDEIKEPMQQIGGAVQGAAAAAHAVRNPGQAMREAVMRELSEKPAPEEKPQTPDTAAPAPLLDESSVPPPAKESEPPVAPAAAEPPAAAEDTRGQGEPDAEEAR